MTQYARTERDLYALANAFSTGKITQGLPERLECLAAWHRLSIEAEKSGDGQPHNYEAAGEAYMTSIKRLHMAGVDFSDGEFTFSPCMGPDLPLPSPKCST